MTVILVAVGSRTTPKVVIFKTYSFQQLQCLFLYTKILLYFFIGHLQIDACILEGEGLIVAFEGHLNKLLVSENQGFLKILNRSRL